MNIWAIAVLALIITIYLSLVTGTFIKLIIKGYKMSGLKKSSIILLPILNVIAAIWSEIKQEKRKATIISVLTSIWISFIFFPIIVGVISENGVFVKQTKRIKKAKHIKGDSGQRRGLKEPVKALNSFYENKSIMSNLGPAL